MKRKSDTPSKGGENSCISMFAVAISQGIYAGQNTTGWSSILTTTTGNIPAVTAIVGILAMLLIVVKVAGSAGIGGGGGAGGL